MNADLSVYEKIRDQRKRELESHVAEVNALLAKQVNSSDDEGENGTKSTGQAEVDDEGWAGIDDGHATHDTAEYVDEGRFTTVTIKELDDVRDFESGSDTGEGDNNGDAAGGRDDEADASQRKEKKVRKRWVKGKLVEDDGKSKQRSKKRNFRYESKLDRQTARQKVKKKKIAAAKQRREEA